MTLDEKILTIDYPSIASIKGVGLLPTGAADTIENFFQEFIEPRLPDVNIVKRWHRLLMEYTEEKNWADLSCCIRFGNSGGKKKSSEGEVGYYKLRRGWLTKNTSDNFEYFFADNAFPAFVYKMALDKFCPESVDEFREAFRRHKFPYGFGFMIDNTVNEYKGVTIDVAKNPGFLGNYKLSHIFDAGEFFEIGGKKYGDAGLTSKYYPIGHSNDYLKHSDRVRRMFIDDEAKRVIVAKFLRFAHPFNYFLTPTKKHHICGVPVYKKDIGEDLRMVSYVRGYLKATYPEEYKEFLERIMWYGDPEGEGKFGGEKIDITYGLNVDSKGGGKSAKAPKTPKSIIELDKISYEYLKDGKFKVSAIVREVLGAILRSGQMSKSEVEAFKTAAYTKAVFGFGKPLLSPVLVRTSGLNRYYADGFTLYDEKVYLYSQWLESHKPKLIKWILDWIDVHGRII